MKHRVLSFSIVVILAVLITGDSHGRNVAPAEPATVSRAQDAAGSSLVPAPQATSPGVLQLWTFDNAGNPDPQGWTTRDRTVQPPYFHVDNFAGLSFPYAPTVGTKSLWLGRGPCAQPSECGYATLPGYGNSWNQRFQSDPLNVAGNITVEFYLRYDMEASYDFLYLEYRNPAGGAWSTAASWTGVGNIAVNQAIPWSSPQIQLRLRFASDNAYSDEDGLYNSSGAAVIDNLTVKHFGGAITVNSQTFEAEAVGATVTNDGKWEAFGPPSYGDHAALFNGAGVKQDDPSTVNATNFWGFFSGSSAQYICGNPQAAIPTGGWIEDQPSFIDNDVVSPIVSIATVPGTDPVLLTFDMYPDMPADYLVTYTYSVRSRVAGVWKTWKSGGTTFPDYQTWRTYTHNLRPLIASGATDIQVAIGVVDACPYFCTPYTPTVCHRHAPLIDNVRVTTSNTATGSNVVVQPVDATTSTTPVTVTYGSVSLAGLTSLETAATGPTPPGTFTIGGGTYYNLSTTATTSGTIQVCISYDESSLGVPEGSLRILHWDTQLNPDAWVDITSSLNTATNVICGTTDHLSPFVIGGGSLTGTGGPTALAALALHQNVPNPFNPSTTITYDVPEGGAAVAIRVYDAGGRLVRTLVDETRPGGTHSVTWDGRDSFGTAVSSGVYFYRMTSGAFSESRRMVLLK